MRSMGFLRVWCDRCGWVVIRGRGGPSGDPPTAPPAPIRGVCRRPRASAPWRASAPADGRAAG
ncbi:hypothetical protein H490_0109545 [Leucobacter sp. UCD-THU]|nr:hypothetical protein H490_0109545 [Leucobacter sp. UCD-THU]